MTSSEKTNSGVEIRPFYIAIPQDNLQDLHTRLSRTRWPDELPGVGWSYGAPLGYLKELAGYWKSSYDWRKHEARLNKLSQFTTTIDGTNIHFVHVRSREPKALPLIMTHGWPSSFVEFLEIIDPLTNPRDHGADASDAFHLVIPSIPGFGFSGPTHETGWDIGRIARAWAILMKRLGYDHYGAQGGDWGSPISRDLALVAGDRVVGVHLNNLFSPPPSDPAESGKLTAAERKRLERREQIVKTGRGYAEMQSSRPQTLAYGLNDSPVGQLAWIVEKFKEWTDSKDWPEDAVDRDQMLTNVMIYWLTRTAGSSARIYYEVANFAQTGGKVEQPTTPIGVAVFPYDTVPSIRSFAEKYNNIVHWSEFDRGGHFPAMEEPDLLTADIRRFFSRFR